MLLILASSSPFRKAILEKLRIDFKATAPNINERRKNGETPFNLVNRLSKEKALEVAKSHSGLIIASDQVATLGNGNNEDDEILTKPGSHENAFLQLKKSSGKTITFLTG
ncbi:MAG: septum formation inhibitor Maf, partial [Gammaproteobacteria bacterium]|nr:septum formation inhibitor Maf [Gammaproteobacteria bacterium]